MQKSILALRLIRFGLGMKLRSLFKFRTSKKIFGNWYNIITQFTQLIMDEFICMNYGYIGGDNLNLLPEDESERYPLQLYNLVATGQGTLDLAGLEVLEVGSGRGGGASFVARYLKPAQITGLDLSENATKFCKERYQPVANLRFINGDAEALPFADQSFDAVINVESSHCYPHFHKFVSEVYRALKPGGHFLITDFRLTPELADFKKALTEPGFTILREQDISGNILEALTIDTQRRLDLINKNKLPWFVKFPLKNFAGCSNSITYNSYKTGKRKYLAFVLQKAE